MKEIEGGARGVVGGISMFAFSAPELPGQRATPLALFLSVSYFIKLPSSRVLGQVTQLLDRVKYLTTGSKNIKGVEEPIGKEVNG